MAIVDDRECRWSWGSKTLRIDGPTLVVTDSRALPDTQTYSLGDAFDDPGRLFIDPPEVYAAVMRALAQRLADDDVGGADSRRRPRRAFWLALGPAGCAPLAVSWSYASSPERTPTTFTLDLAGLVALCTAPPDSYTERKRQMIDDLFFFGPLEIAIPAATRALVIDTILAALAPNSGVEARHAFPLIDHARIARATWTWDKTDDGEASADVGGPAVVSGYQHGHDFGWSAYSAERVATRAPGLYPGAPRDVWEAIVAAVRAAIVSP